MASLFEIFPAALMAKEEWEDVIFLLQQLPVSQRRKKELLVEWTKLTGAVLTHEMVEKLLGPLGEGGRYGLRT